MPFNAVSSFPCPTLGDRLILPGILFSSTPPTMLQLAGLSLHHPEEQVPKVGKAAGPGSLWEGWPEARQPPALPRSSGRQAALPLSPCLGWDPVPDLGRAEGW